MNELYWLIPELSFSQWFGHAAILTTNIILFFLAKPFIIYIEKDQEKEYGKKINTLRFINILIFFLHAFGLITLSINNHYQNFFINIGLSLLTIYISLLIYTVFSFFSLKRFGNEKVIDDKIFYVNTYSTRIIDILTFSIILLSTIYAIIKIYGADTLLETTGIFGIIIAFFAFTSNIWAPDIISGLIILNSQILEDGDVVKVDGYSDEYIINKVSLIYIILYDIRNNHRTLIRNSRFIQSKIDNLSRVASTDGLRQSLKYNIGYPDIESEEKEEDRIKKLALFKSKTDKLFEKSYDICINDDSIKINKKRSFEWALTNTGDFALEYTLWFYLERLPNTRVTATIRNALIKSRFKVNESVYSSAVSMGIKLSTPRLEKIEIEQSPHQKTIGPLI